VFDSYSGGNWFYSATSIYTSCTETLTYYFNNVKYLNSTYPLYASTPAGLCTPTAGSTTNAFTCTCVVGSTSTYNSCKFAITADGSYGYSYGATCP